MSVYATRNFVSLNGIEASIMKNTKFLIGMTLGSIEYSYENKTVSNFLD